MAFPLFGWLCYGILMRLGENPNFKHSEILSLDGARLGVGINIHARKKRRFEERPRTKDSMNGRGRDRYILNLIASWPCYRFSILILRGSARSARKGKLQLPLQHGLQRNQHHFSPRLHIQLPSPACLLPGKEHPLIDFPPRLAGFPPIRFC